MTGIIAQIGIRFTWDTHHGYGRFCRKSDGTYVLEIADRYGTYLGPRSYDLPEIRNCDHARAICVAVAMRHRGGNDRVVQPRARLQ